jgi:GT2 family glycosyltransferase
MLNLQNPDLIDDAGDSFSWYGSARKWGQGEPAAMYTRPEEVFSACAGAALYRRVFFEEVGLFDEGFESYLEDIDLGLRGHLLGYRCLYVPKAEVWHQGQGAGTPRPRYVYLMSRNRLAVITKNIPTGLLFKHANTLLFGQIYFFLVYKKPLRSLAGFFSFLYSLPGLLRQRRDIQRRRKVSDHVLESVLSDELGEPSLSEIIRARWKVR